ncbi:uncharacterized protein LOC113464669 [Ceratina calcarata]|uniref:Uncharacterized protein LOC113464669 n=1 Tax=Ceratina calcarata TaxID=156304 RepID=A0AAJ7S4W6_9HYME|nr:uncharacterized protein LOC113464669 [Ceratina calcarata]
MIEHYMRVTKMYASAVGIWPHQSPVRKNILRIYINVMVVLSLITQISRVVLYASTDSLVDQIPFLGVAVATFVKYSNYQFNDVKFRKLFDSMSNDWQNKMTEDEMTIMQKYGDRGVFFIFIYIVNAYVCIAAFLLRPLVPKAMDLIMPLNESRHRMEMYPAYYFTDNPDKYYYGIIIFTTMCTITAMSVFVASDTLLIYSVQHVCGLLALTGSRFKYSLDSLYSLTDDTNVDNERLYKNVCDAINSHKRAFAYITEIESAYAINLFVQVGVVIISFTITLFQGVSFIQFLGARGAPIG